MAGQFLADYQEDPASALADLVNMVLKSAGCDLQVTTDDIEDTDNVTGKLGDLQDEFQSVGQRAIWCILWTNIVSDRILRLPSHLQGEK